MQTMQAKGAPMEVDGIVKEEKTTINPNVAKNI